MSDPQSKQTPNSWVALAIVILAFLGYSIPTSTAKRPSSQGNYDSEKAFTSSTDKDSFEPLMPLCRYLDDPDQSEISSTPFLEQSTVKNSPTPSPNRPETDGSGCLAQLRGDRLTIKPGHEIRFLIFMVPDPIDSAAALPVFSNGLWSLLQPVVRLFQ